MKKMAMSLFALLALTAGVARAELKFEKSSMYAGVVRLGGDLVWGYAQIKVTKTGADGRTKVTVGLVACDGNKTTVKLVLTPGPHPEGSWAGEALLAPETSLATGGVIRDVVLTADAFDARIVAPDTPFDNLTIWGGPMPSFSEGGEAAFKQDIYTAGKYRSACLTATAERTYPIPGYLKPSPKMPSQSTFILPNGTKVQAKGYAFVRWDSYFFPLIVVQKAPVKDHLTCLTYFDPRDNWWDLDSVGRWWWSPSYLSLDPTQYDFDLNEECVFPVDLKDGDYTFSIGSSVPGTVVNPRTWLNLTEGQKVALRTDLLPMGTSGVKVIASNGKLILPRSRANRIFKPRRGVVAPEGTVIEIATPANPCGLKLSRSRTNGLVSGSFAAWFLTPTRLGPKLTSATFKVSMTVNGDRGRGTASNPLYGTLPVTLTRK